MSFKKIILSCALLALSTTQGFSAEIITQNDGMDDLAQILGSKRLYCAEKIDQFLGIEKQSIELQMGRTLDGKLSAIYSDHNFNLANAMGNVWFKLTNENFSLYIGEDAPQDVFTIARSTLEKNSKITTESDTFEAIHTYEYVPGTKPTHYECKILNY